VGHGLALDTSRLVTCAQIITRESLVMDLQAGTCPSCWPSPGFGSRWAWL